MYLVAVFVILAIWYLVSYLKWKKNVYNYMEKIPGGKRYPIFGTDYIFLGVPKEEIFDVMIEYLKQYKPFFRTWNGATPEVHVMKPEHLELVMNNSVHITKGRQYDRLHPWLGQGLLTSTGGRWFQHRKLITPTFHFKILENFMEVFVEKTETLLHMLDSKANATTFNIYPDITKCALDIICETAMGVQVDAMSGKNQIYIDAIYEITDIFLWRALRPFINDFIFNLMPKGRRFKEDLSILHEFSKKIIAERKTLLKTKKNSDTSVTCDEEVFGKKKRMSFLDLLLEASNDGEVLSDNDIREEVDTFMFEGHDTTTAGICWSLFLLGSHPEVQERVFEEVRSVLHNKEMPSSINELQELKYLERVIKESLRLYPSVPFIMRSLQEEITIDGYKVPAGVEVILHIYGAHRNEDHYPNPNKFDPDRFLPENSMNRHPYAYVPFSAGPRNCIGQKFAMYEEKTILASIINRYKVIATQSERDIKVSPDLILRPINGVFIKLEKRK